VSEGTSKPYPLTLICEVWRVARSTVYAVRRKPGPVSEPQKRGPKTELSDEELVVQIRTVLKKSKFLGEGYRKVLELVMAYERVTDHLDRRPELVEAT
jgi:putative transposase